jgi:hypothetical protein
MDCGENDVRLQLGGHTRAQKTGGWWRGWEGWEGWRGEERIWEEDEKMEKMEEMEERWKRRTRGEEGERRKHEQKTKQIIRLGITRFDENQPYPPRFGLHGIEWMGQKEVRTYRR